MATAIEFNNVSKQYRLGLVSTRTLSHDLQRWWTINILGKEDPYLKVGSVNDRSKKADSEYVWALKNIDFKVEQGDVIGIIGSHGATNTVYQVLPVEIVPEGGGEIEIPEVASFEELYALTKGVNAKFTTEITAIFQSDITTYVKDAEGNYGLVYGATQDALENGDVIKDAIANWTLYNDMTEIVPKKETWVVDHKGALVEPEEFVLEDVGLDMAHSYIIIKDATITPDESVEVEEGKKLLDYFIADETADGIKLYNKFFKKVDMPEDLSKPYDVTCFVTLYKKDGNTVLCCRHRLLGQRARWP